MLISHVNHHAISQLISHVNQFSFHHNHNHHNHNHQNNPNHNQSLCHQSVKQSCYSVNSISQL